MKPSEELKKIANDLNKVSNPTDWYKTELEEKGAKRIKSVVEILAEKADAFIDALKGLDVGYYPPTIAPDGNKATVEVNWYLTEFEPLWALVDQFGGEETHAEVLEYEEASTNKTSGSVPITSLCEGAQTLKGYGSDIQVSADMGQVLFGLEWAELSPEDQEQLSALGFGPSAGEVALYL